MVGSLNCSKNSIVFSLVEVTATPAAVCLLRMLSGMSSLSLLVVPCPQLELLLFCFLAGGDPSAGCLSRFSRTGFVFLEDLLAEADVAAAAVAAAVATTAFVAVVVAVVTVVAVIELTPVVATVDVEFAATVTDFASLLLDFRFLGRKIMSGVDAVVTFATDFST